MAVRLPVSYTHLDVYKRQVGAIAYGDKGFTTLRTFLLLFTDNAYIGISAVGMTMVLITGGIDLSVAAVASLTGMFIAYGNTILGINPFICIGFALLVGIGLGLLMGATIHYPVSYTHLDVYKRQPSCTGR